MMFKHMKSEKGAANALMIIVIVLLVVIILGVGYVAFKDKYKVSVTDTTNTTTNEAKDTEDEDKDDTEDEDGEDTTSDVKTASLVNVYDGKGTGTATSKKVDGKYVLEIKTSGLPDPEKDFQYEAWLEKKVPFSRINGGILKKQEDGIYTLEFKPDTDYSLYRFVYVSLEPKEDEDRDPDEKVLDGNFL